MLHFPVLRQLIGQLNVYLHYGLAARLLTKSDLKYRDYVLFSSFSKILRTKSKDVIDQCMIKQIVLLVLLFL